MSNPIRINSSLVLSNLEIGSGFRGQFSRISNIINNSALASNITLQQRIGKALQENTRNARTFASQIDIAAKRLTAWALASTALFKATQTVSDLSSEIVQLSKDTTTLRTILPALTTNFDDVNQSILKISNKIGVPFKEARDAFIEIARAGLGLSDSLKVLEKASTARAIGEFGDIKKAFLDLLPIIQQFTLRVEDYGSVLDKVSILAVRFATTESDLTDVIKRAGAAFAEQADGASDALDKLLALSTAAKQITQLPSSVIGTSLRSIASRLGSEKILGKLEEGFGFQFRDFSGNIKPAFDILEDIAAIFPKLTDAQKQSIASTVGERRNVQVLVNILSQWNEVTKAQAVLQSASGSATRRLTQHTDSLRASIERAKNSFGGFAEELRKGGVESTFKSLADSAAALGSALSTPGVAQLFVGGLLGGGALGIGKLIGAGVNKFNRPNDISQSIGRGGTAVLQNIGTEDLLNRAKVTGFSKEKLARFSNLLGSISDASVGVLNINNRTDELVKFNQLRQKRATTGLTPREETLFKSLKPEVKAGILQDQSILTGQKISDKELKITRKIFDRLESQNIVGRLATGKLDLENLGGTGQTRDLVKKAIEKSLSTKSQNLLSAGRLGILTDPAEKRRFQVIEKEIAAREKVVTSLLASQAAHEKEAIATNKANIALGIASAGLAVGVLAQRAGTAVGGTTGRVLKGVGGGIEQGSLGFILGQGINGLKGGLIGAGIGVSLAALTEFFQVVQENSPEAKIRAAADATQSLLEAQDKLTETTKKLAQISEDTNLQPFQKFLEARGTIDSVRKVFEDIDKQFGTKTEIPPATFEQILSESLTGNKKKVEEIISGVFDISKGEGRKKLENILPDILGKFETSALIAQQQKAQAAAMGLPPSELEDKAALARRTDKLSKDLSPVSGPILQDIVDRAKNLGDAGKGIGDFFQAFHINGTELQQAFIEARGGRDALEKQINVFAGLSPKVGKALDDLDKRVKNFITSLQSSTAKLSAGLDLNTKLFEDSVKKFETLNGTARPGDIFQDFQKRFGGVVNLRRAPVDEIDKFVRAGGGKFGQFLGPDLTKGLNLDFLDKIIDDVIKVQGHIKAGAAESSKGKFDAENFGHSMEELLDELNINDLVKKAIESIKGPDLEKNVNVLGRDISKIFELEPIKDAFNALTDSAKARKNQVEAAASAVEKILDPLLDSIKGLGSFAATASGKDLFKQNRGLAGFQTVFGPLHNFGTTQGIQTNPAALNFIGQRFATLPQQIRQEIFEALGKFGNIPVTPQGITGKQAQDLIGGSLFPQAFAGVNQAKQKVFGQLGIGPQDIQLFGSEGAIQKELLVQSKAQTEIQKQLLQNTGGGGSFAGGGIVKGPPSKRDNKFIKVRSGEEIITPEDPRHSKNLQGFADGGVVRGGFGELISKNALEKLKELRRKQEELENKGHSRATDRFNNAPDSIKKFEDNAFTLQELRRRLIRKHTEEAIAKRGNARTFEEIADAGVGHGVFRGENLTGTSSSGRGTLTVLNGSSRGQKASRINIDDIRGHTTAQGISDLVKTKGLIPGVIRDPRTSEPFIKPAARPKGFAAINGVELRKGVKTFGGQPLFNKSITSNGLVQEKRGGIRLIPSDPAFKDPFGIDTGPPANLLPTPGSLPPRRSPRDFQGDFNDAIFEGQRRRADINQGARSARDSSSSMEWEKRMQRGRQEMGLGATDESMFFKDLGNQLKESIKQGIDESNLQANISLAPVQGNVSVDVGNDPVAIQALAQAGLIIAMLEQFTKTQGIGGQVQVGMRNALAAMKASLGGSTANANKEGEGQ